MIPRLPLPEKAVVPSKPTPVPPCHAGRKNMEKWMRWSKRSREDMFRTYAALLPRLAQEETLE